MIMHTFIAMLGSATALFFMTGKVGYKRFFPVAVTLLYLYAVEVQTRAPDRTLLQIGNSLALAGLLILIFLIVRLVCQADEDHDLAELYHAVLQNLSEGVAVTDHRGLLVYANPTYRLRLGLKPDDLDCEARPFPTKNAAASLGRKINVAPVSHGLVEEAHSVPIRSGPLGRKGLCLTQLDKEVVNRHFERAMTLFKTLIEVSPAQVLVFDATLQLQMSHWAAVPALAPAGREALLARLVEPVAQTLQDGKPIEGFTVVLPEGSRSERTFHCDLYPVADEDQACFATLVQVKEVIQKTDTCKVSSRHFRKFLQLFAKAGVGIWSWNARDGFSDFYGLEPLLGPLTESELENPSLLLRRVRGEDRQIVRDALPEALRNRSGFDINVGMACASGEIRYLNLCGRVLRGSAAEPDQMLGFVRDISARRHNEIVAYNDRARLRSVLQTTADGIITMNKRGIVDSFNDSASRIFNYSAVEVIGQNVAMLLEHDAAIEFNEQLSRYLGTAEDYTLGKDHQVVGRRKDGTTFPLTLAVNATILAGEVLFIGLVHDLSEEKYIEEKNRELETGMRQLQKLETIGTLTGGFAHDFNESLNPIMGYSEMALNDIENKEALSHCLKKVVSASKHARDLVKQVLTLATQHEQKKEPILIFPLLADSLKLLRYNLPMNIKIAINPCAEKCYVHAAPVQIYQLIMNLCSNAFKAMEEGGGTLEASSRCIEVSPEQAERVADLKPGPYFHLHIADMGPGMDRATLERIFEPLFTTRPRGEGKGMGLTVVHGIVMGHGGAITVKSKLGTGTCVDVYLPRVFPLETNQVASVPHTHAARGERHRILLVDDQTMIVEMFCQILESLNYQVTAHTSPDKALADFVDRQNEFDLLLTDYTMPIMTGDLLVQHIHAHRPDLPVIMMSGYNARINGQTIRDMGVFDFLPKPVDRELLAGTLARALSPN